jgi:hypothetical protein
MRATKAVPDVDRLTAHDGRSEGAKMEFGYAPRPRIATNEIEEVDHWGA